MAAKMEATRYTGVFKRGSRYVAVWRAGGRQRKRSARTLEAARKLRASMQADLARGEYDERSKLTFGAYGPEWVDRYHGNGRGLREHTRADYRRMLEHFLIPWFDGQVPDQRAPKRALTLTEIRPRDVGNLVGWLADEQAQLEHERRLAGEKVREAERHLRAAGDDGRREARERLAAAKRRVRRLRELEGKRLSDKTIGNILVPLRSCLSTAVDEGLIRHNPTARVKLPHRPSLDEDEHEEVRALSREQLATLLGLLPERWRLLFRVLAATGLRISELISLEWRHLVLDGSRPHVKVRRAIVRSKLGPVKSKHGKRDVPLSFKLADDLARHRKDSEWPGDEHPVFPSMTGTPLDPGNLRRRVLAPAAEEAGVTWCGLHTFRHSCATLLFARGRNAVQVQRWLGHHSAAFTLSTYVHLLDEDVGEPLDLAGELAQGGVKVAPRPGSAGLDGHEADEADSALEAGSPSPDETGRDPSSGS